MRRAIPRGIIYHRLRDDLASLGRALCGPLDEPAPIAAFEQAFAAAHGRKHGIAFPSARTAIWASLRARALPRATLLASPALWLGPRLIAAPLARSGESWKISLAPGREDFAASLLAH
jgi:hypothetical protein